MMVLARLLQERALFRTLYRLDGLMAPFSSLVQGCVTMLFALRVAWHPPPVHVCLFSSLLCIGHCWIVSGPFYSSTTSCSWILAAVVLCLNEAIIEVLGIAVPICEFQGRQNSTYKIGLPLKINNFSFSLGNKGKQIKPQE